MPPKKTKKATKPKKGKGKTTKMSQVQTTRFNVRVAGGPGGPGGGGVAGGGSGGGAYLSVPQGYGTTYAPPPQPSMGYGSQVPKTPYMPSTYEPTPVKREPQNIFPRGFRTSPPALLDLNPTAF